MPLSDFVDKHRTALSVGAMLVGVLAVLTGVTRERASADLLPGEAARVNGQAIDSDTFQRTFTGFSDGLKRPVTAADRTMILNETIIGVSLKHQGAYSVTMTSLLRLYAGTLLRL